MLNKSQHLSATRHAILAVIFREYPQIHIVRSALVRRIHGNTKNRFQRFFFLCSRNGLNGFQKRTLEITLKRLLFQQENIRIEPLQHFCLAAILRSQSPQRLTFLISSHYSDDLLKKTIVVYQKLKKLENPFVGYREMVKGSAQKDNHAFSTQKSA